MKCRGGFGPGDQLASLDLPAPRRVLGFTYDGTSERGRDAQAFESRPTTEST